MRADESNTQFAFKEEDFPTRSYAEYPTDFCNLQNDNFFAESKFPMFHNHPSGHYGYHLIEPALRLISRIILDQWDSYSVLVKRRQAGDSDTFLNEDTRVSLTKDQVIENIKGSIPNIEFDPRMDANSSDFATTILCPENLRDVVVLDYTLIRLLKHLMICDNQKLAGLLFTAILIGHELAHVLEFRNIRQGRLQVNGEPFETPPGITCREAGTMWETRVFHGQVNPVCDMENSLITIRGLSIRSAAWNYEVMKVNDDWIRSIFSESHWNRTVHPLQIPIDIYARHALLEDELLASNAFSPVKTKSHERDVQVWTGSPRRACRATQHRICGGKRVERGV